MLGGKGTKGLLDPHPPLLCSLPLWEEALKCVAAVGMDGIVLRAS